MSFKKSLRSLGFETYRAYLVSELWITIRARVMERDEGTCRVCKRPAKHVHHCSYAKPVLAGEDDSALVSLCFGCHQRLEFDGERKRGKREVMEIGIKWGLLKRPEVVEKPKSTKPRLPKKPKKFVDGNKPAGKQQQNAMRSILKRHGIPVDEKRLKNLTKGGWVVWINEIKAIIKNKRRTAPEPTPKYAPIPTFPVRVFLDDSETAENNV